MKKPPISWTIYIPLRLAPIAVLGFLGWNFLPWDIQQKFLATVTNPIASLSTLF